MGTDEAMESELGLGELAGLTVANEADSLAYDVSSKRQNGSLRPMGSFLKGKLFLFMLSLESYETTTPHSSKFMESHHILKTCLVENSTKTIYSVLYLINLTWIFVNICLF